ncbi:MAG: undecaprenyl-diphosphate phosphatase [archaeon]|nr:undecaprenyl-diphosphate phosphatase [archaeon]
MILSLNFFQEFILAIIQAILEWLPVSSEGFIVLTAVNVFNESAEEALQIAIWFHLGTALAVFTKYWRIYLDAIFKDRTILRLLILSVIGTAIVGIPIYFFISDIFLEINGMLITLLIGITLAITATLLRFGRLKGSESLNMEERRTTDEFGLGLVQGFSILPGISRSGVTMTYLVLRGYKKEDAFKISFIISLPAVVGGIALDLFKTLFIDDESLIFGFEYIILMGIVAILGYLMMDVLLRLVKKVSFDKICYILSVTTIGLVLIYYFLI